MAGQTVPNLVVVKVPPSGVIDFFNSAGYTDVVADLVGYFHSDTTTEDGRFIPFVPFRSFDSREIVAGRSNGLPFGPGQSLALLDDLGVGGVVVNITVTQPTSSGYVTAYPHPGPVPLASNVNFTSGQTVANSAYVAMIEGVGFYNAFGNTHMIIDVFGAFT